MMKFGIYRLGQLKSEQLRTFLGGKKKISVSILYDNDVADIDDEIYEAIMFEQVDDRGAYKRTAADRFRVFDSAITELISSSNPDKFRVHDVGVSNARTSVDSFLRLRKQVPNCIYHASDYCPYLTLLRKAKLTIVLSGTNKIVDITYPPFVFTPFQLESHLFYPVNHLVRLMLERGPIRRLLKQHEQGDTNGYLIDQLNLFCPAARSLAESTDAFTLGQYDLLTPYRDAGSFDCVRAMNVLNDTYFCDSQMQLILQNIFASLEDHGLFIVGSNQDADSTVDGGAYRKTTAGFQQEFMSGSPDRIEKHISRFNQSLASRNP